MNVVKREDPGMRLRRPNLKRKQIGFIRNKQNTGLGILGPNSRLSLRCAPAAVPCPPPTVPRYHFSNEPSTSKSKKSSMGPPTGPIRPLKKRAPPQSGSGITEWSSGSVVRPQVLANDTIADSMHTPANRPTPIHYVSSSSRGRQHSSRSTTTSVAEPSVILAITEGRGIARCEIGLAAVDLRRPHLVLCQFSDSLLYTHTLTKVNYFNPVEIIVPHTFCEAQPKPLYQLLRDRCPGVTLSTVHRRHFNDALGRQQVQSLCAPAYSAVYIQLLHKFYALTAAAAVLTYVEYIQCVVFAQGSLKVEYHSSENTMLIDVDTARQLELVTPLEPSAGPMCCLLGVLGPLRTAGGARALRAAILQPSSDAALIEERLNCVRELVEDDEGLTSGVQDVLSKLCDVEKVLFLCLELPKQDTSRTSVAQMNQTLLLKTSMELVPPLVQALSLAQSGRLRMIKMDLENPHYEEIAGRIRRVLQEDARMEKGSLGGLQRCFAVRPDINGLLDVARRTYSELVDDIQRMVEGLSETYDLPIRLNQNVLKGFHIVLPLAPRDRRNFSVDSLPAIFIQVQSSGASVTMTTEELVVLDQQAKESLNEIHSMSNIVIYGLLKELRPFMGSLYKLCENIAELDILLALAHASSVNSYIRPEFNEYIDIRNSVHPLLDYNSQKMPVPNDIFASPEYNFTVVTGPNMGGKSIYIKQIAVLHVMAQIGCFVPATRAVLRLTDHIFSRIGFNDSVELNASTFVLEMKEIQYILKDLSPTSLVIIDELCRGLCNEEGASLAWAVCEELLQRSAFTFFTTHFLYLTRLEHLYLNVTNLHTSVGEETIPNSNEKRLLYHHKVVPGVTEVEKYGLALARNTNLPEMTIKLAEQLAEVIVQHKKPQAQLDPERTDEILLYKLYADMKKEIRKSTDNDAAVKNLLESFRKNHPALMQKLKAMDESKTEMSATSAPASSKSSVTPANHIKPTDGHTSSSIENLPVLQEENTQRPGPSVLTTNLTEHAQDLNNKDINNTVEEGNDMINLEHFAIKNTTQLLNTIPLDYNCFIADNSNANDLEKNNQNFESFRESDTDLDEASLWVIDEIKSDGNHTLRSENRFSSDYENQTMMSDNVSLQISPPALNCVDSADCSIQQVLKINALHINDNTSHSPEEVLQNLASQSTLVLDDRSNCLSPSSSSSFSSVDRQLIFETVVEIHNEMEPTASGAHQPEENELANFGSQDDSEIDWDIVLPPPIEFAD